MSTPVQLVWSAQPGTNQLSFGTALNFGIENTYVLNARASYQDVEQPAKYFTVDNLINADAVSVTLGAQTTTIPPFQRLTIPAVLSANSITFRQNAGVGSVNVQAFNYNPNLQDAIDFLAILSRVSLQIANWAVDSAGSPNYVAALAPVPTSIPNGTFVMMLPSSSSPGGVAVTFNLNGFGAFPVRWRGINPMKEQIRANVPIALVLVNNVWNIVAHPQKGSIVQDSDDVFTLINNGGTTSALVYTALTTADIPYALQGDANSIVIAECSYVASFSGSGAGETGSLRVQESSFPFLGDDMFQFSSAGAVATSLAFPGLIRGRATGFPAGSNLKWRVFGKVSAGTAVIQATAQKWSFKEIN